MRSISAKRTKTQVNDTSGTALLSELIKKKHFLYKILDLLSK